MLNAGEIILINRELRSLTRMGLVHIVQDAGLTVGMFDDAGDLHAKIRALIDDGTLNTADIFRNMGVTPIDKAGCEI